MRAAIQKQEQKIKLKLCIKTQQFKYQQQGRLNKRSLSTKNKQIVESKATLKILEHKLYSSPSNHPQTERINTQRIRSSLQQNVNSMAKDSLAQIHNNYYEPRKSMFNRFCYQNYNNYQYKNPLTPSRYPIDDKILKKLASVPNRGQSKNLQIIFCERKYKDFVEKSNDQMKAIFENKRGIPTFSRNKKPRVKSMLELGKNNSKQKNRTFNIKKHKTNLSNYLQQFQTLEKLSQYMEREHKLNEKYLLHKSAENHQTVLLDILTCRFDFLKNGKKKMRDLLYKSVFGFSEIGTYTKIGIQDYIKFIRIFISRDAQQPELAMFIFCFLFKTQTDPTLQEALKTLDLIGGTIHKHKLVQSCIIQMLEQSHNESMKFYQRVLQNKIFLKNFIDLILQN